MEAVGLRHQGSVARYNGGLALGLILLIIAITSVALGVNEVYRGPDILGNVLPLVPFGLILGWVLSSRRWVFWLTLILGGLLINILKVGHLGGEVLSLIGLAPRVILETYTKPIGQSAAIHQLVESMSHITSDIAVLIERSSSWVSRFLTADPVSDPVVIALFFGFGFWSISLWAGWTTRRRKDPFLALLPAGVLLSVSLSNAWVVSSQLYIFLGASVLLLALLHLHTNQTRWERNLIDYPEGIAVELGLATGAATIALLILSAISPHITFRQIVELFQGREGVTSITTPLPGGAGVGQGRSQVLRTIFDAASPSGLPRDHLIGSGPELSQRPVMKIHLLNSPTTTSAGPDAIYYWRGLTYDVYTGSGWSTSNAYAASLSAHEQLSITDPSFGLLLDQQIRWLTESDSLIYTSGEVSTVDEDFSVAWRGVSDIFAATVEEDMYTVTSRMTFADEDDLREAGNNYPDWVADHYLGSFENTSAKVSELALGLTATEPTPYDRALAIETYLRQFPYTLDVSAPPAGKDVVEYFLFDLQEGYCDYYATAMVVMARAAGLPARLAVGYASGSYDEAQDAFLVSEAEAHSWVEIFFPGIGWTIFEPTAGRASFQRIALDRTGSDWDGTPTAPGSTGPPNPIFALLIVALALGVGVLIRSVAHLHILRRESPGTVVIGTYFRLRTFCEHLPLPIYPGDTPNEFSNRLAVFATTIAENVPIGDWLAPVAGDVRSIAELVVEEKFSLHKLETSAKERVIRIRRDLIPRLWLLWICCRVGGYD